MVPNNRYREPRWSTLEPPEVREFRSPAMQRLLADCAIQLGEGSIDEAIKNYRASLIKEVPAAEKKNGIRFAALVGKGRYVWEDGKYLTGAAAVPVPGEANGAYGPGNHVRLAQNFSEPALVLLLDGNPTEKWLKCSGQIVVRLLSGENGYQMSDGGGGGSTDGKGNQKIEKQFCAPSDKQGHRVPLSGPVSIQIVPVEPETVDFIVAPPPLPAPR